ncbi:uncharacterized protein LOC111057346 isoform X1 [Nilaparvata lugens]|uniref:uncharacterized protein LOC111057346 isoform X1 n=1 Tax=Nilaparvata lugens TaxID=108931 RepID=UPI00193CDCB3|nr:uncharacterized protein LOC111057346 isoform X1 [Nilaparvata lugens]XP_039289984.1 uncharacterized protein LOC111057346 isoform X1 [Nilaparvata lugens]XP_039289985.1 uncharacterized protein LOC111057346 isoform X1 [Nilaparvata lugens]XP_039289986.1 uncharacterized protein LOC111057346 isoform X1 [Nilaparvata lugens]XP_039289988.1 uncharacterized protein LOC111057346 isoform X1 [Nilaparvata lugens]XP_039289989.1 uncharacterized protein LOC111057346 isoform X1 [Nilaparvata lugens]XP_03928999
MEEETKINDDNQQKRIRKISNARFKPEVEDSRMGLNHRKESNAGLCSEDITPSEEKLLDYDFYPFAVVLRLRVLQIVCGVSVLVMGTVAFIQERGSLNLGLGMPAGIITVTAAAVSIHTSRGFSGYSQPNCVPQLRFLGPTVRVAIPLTCLWMCSITLHTVLSILAVVSLVTSPDTTVLAAILLFLSFLCLLAVVLIVRIDCTYDPD